MIFIILAVFFGYFVFAALCESAAQKNLGVSQNLYHHWRVEQSGMVFLLAIIAAFFCGHFAVFPIVIRSISLVCAFLSNDAYYNRLLWFKVTGNWNHDSNDGTWWGKLHPSPEADWQRFRWCLGLSILFAIASLIS